MNATATGDIILSNEVSSSQVTVSLEGLWFSSAKLRAEAIGLQRHGNGNRNSSDSAPFKSHELETILPVVAHASHRPRSWPNIRWEVTCWVAWPNCNSFLLYDWWVKGKGTQRDHHSISQSYLKRISLAYSSKTVTYDSSLHKHTAQRQLRILNAYTHSSTTVTNPRHDRSLAKYHILM